MVSYIMEYQNTWPYLDPYRSPKYPPGGIGVINTSPDGRLVRMYWLNGQLAREYHMNRDKIHKGKWKNSYNYHRMDGPAYMSWDWDGEPIEECWYAYGDYHRDGGPAIREFSRGKLYSESWFSHGEYHRIEGPAYVEYDPFGNVCKQKWALHDIYDIGEKAHKRELAPFRHLPMPIYVAILDHYIRWA